MKEQVIHLFKTRIEKLYKEAHDLLLNQVSYQTEVDTKNVLFYFKYLESSLKKPYNRLVALSTYINDDSTFLVSQAYPFALLKTEVKKAINEKHKEAVSLATGLDVTGIDPNYESLDMEEFMKV